jgi:hypothetical protein
MLRRLSAGGVLLLIAVVSYTQSPAPEAMSYEMYSWNVKGHWYYSLLPAGASKSYTDITSNPKVSRDSSGLASELRKLPKHSEVVWMSAAPISAMRPAGSPAILHPSRKRIKHIKAICDKLGIRLKLA